MTRELQGRVQLSSLQPFISTVGFAPTKELERVVNQWHEEDVDCPAKWHVLISVMLLLSVTGAVLRGVGCCVSFTALRVGGKKMQNCHE